MRIPPDAVIDEAKFTRYLLVSRPWEDKSDYCGRPASNWTTGPICSALSGAWLMR